MSFSIQYLPDADVSPAEDRELITLLSSGFPHEAVLKTRRFVHEVPPHRWLVRSPSCELVAQVGVHDKNISLGGNDLHIGGIAEVCVALPFRRQGLVGKMLAEAHGWMAREGIPFSMLFGIKEVYGSSGYVFIDNPVLVNNVLITDKPMIRPISSQPWPEGLVDLRGPRF